MAVFAWIHAFRLFLFDLLKAGHEQKWMPVLPPIFLVSALPPRTFSSSKGSEFTGIFYCVLFHFQVEKITRKFHFFSKSVPLSQDS